MGSAGLLRAAAILFGVVALLPPGVYSQGQWVKADPKGKEMGRKKGFSPNKLENAWRHRMMSKSNTRVQPVFRELKPSGEWEVLL